MTGGILQLASSGKQDIYLTNKPEVTFFKKVFRRHTNYATELVRISPQQTAQYNNMISFVLNIGDCINRCYVEIDLPLLSFPDTYITNSSYISWKQTQINNYNTMLLYWTNYYTNLAGYVNIELQLYRLLNNLLLSSNITINILKDQVNRFNITNKTSKDNYKNKIDQTVYNMINISGYINSITLLTTSVVPNPDPTKYIEISDITSQLNTMYTNMTNYLTYYNNKINKYNLLLSNINSSNIISFNYANFLGHNYFEYFSLEIGGQEITRYNNEVLHINMMHHIKQNDMANYFEMIGNVPILTTFNNNPKGNYKLLIPLMYWFNKDTGSSLPLVALQYSTVILNLKISPINKIISFQNYENMYDMIVNITIDAPTNYILNKNLIYNKYSFDITNKTILYNCILINNELLSLAFPDLTTEEINIILTNNGVQMTYNSIYKLLHPELTLTQIQTMNGTNGLTIQYVVDKNHWIAFMINITNPIYSTLAPKVASYYPYINYNLYYSLIPNPNINLITESVYLDDVERAKFANSQLEYVIENFDENIYKFPIQNSYDCELSFINPCKELLWFIQPQLFIDGLSQYGQNISLNFDVSTYFSNILFTKQNLMLNNYNLILDNVDSNYYTNMLSYKYLNNTLPKGVYYNSFSLFPEESQPSGTVNFSEIKGRQYMVNFNSLFLKEYNDLLKLLYGNNSNLLLNKSSMTLKIISKNYDMFLIHKGASKLLFGI